MFCQIKEFSYGCGIMGHSVHTLNKHSSQDTSIFISNFEIKAIVGYNIFVNE